MRQLATFARQLAGRGRLLLALLPALAQAQVPTITVTPAGPLTLCAGSTQTLTATAIRPGFNVGGAGFDNEVRAVVVQPDGKVLVGGSFTSYDGNAAAANGVLRLNADGSRDASFNPGGSGLGGQAYALVLQADGKVLVGGSFTSYNGGAAPDNVLRLNADGSLDTSFNGGGSGVGGGTVYALGVQANGKVVVGGHFFQYNDSPDEATPDNLLRLTTTGALDASFNGGGAGFDSEVYTLLVQPDDKVLVGGHFTRYNSNSSYSQHLVVLNANGGIDIAGNFHYREGPNGDVLALAVQPNGAVLIGGRFSTFDAQAAPYGLLRLDSYGHRDTQFNAGGRGANASVNALVLQPDGKVLVGGDFLTYNNSAVNRLLRINADGTRDTDFNAGGSGLDLFVNALALQPDGRVVVGGYFTSYNGNAAAPDNLLRLDADGSLDDTAAPATGVTYAWNTGVTGASITVSQPGDYQATATTSAGTGYSNVVRLNAPPVATVTVTPAGPLLLPLGGSAVLSATATVPGYNVGGTGFDGAVYAVLPQPDGKVLVGGSFTGLNGANFATSDRVMRVNADGTRDTGFNSGGVGAGPRSTDVQALALQPDGKVLVGGSFLTYNGATASYLIRLNANGSLDTSFHPSGSFNSTVQALAVQPDGKVLVGGNFTGYVLRLNADGSRDATFNPGGTGPNNSVAALVLQPDGRVLLGGNFTTFNGSAAPGRVLRLTADGTLDATFNGGGFGANSAVQALALQPDGKVLVGGNFTGYNGNLTVPDYVLRLNADGSIDPNFDTGGYSGLTGIFVGALAVQADGKVLVGGSFTDYNYGTAPNNVLRLNANGFLDTGFNGTGSGASGLVYALAPLPGGQVLVGGDFGDYNGVNAPDKLLRLNPDGSLNDAETPLAGATFTFNPGNTTGSTRTVTTPGSYTATATAPATSSCGVVSNAVEVTVTTPYLTSLAPATGVPGSTFDIVGTNLDGATDIRLKSNATGFSGDNLVGSATAVTATRITGVPVQSLSPGTYTVTVTTAIGVSNGLTFTVPNRAPTGLTLSSTSIAENLPPNGLVGRFAATDPDIGDPHTYVLVSGAGSDDNDSFTISGNTLRLIASADYETKNSYAVRVRTTDGAGQSFEQPFTITVRNVNEAPSISPQTRSIAENSPNGTLVGAPLTATDPDANTSLRYNITGGNGTGSGAFALNARTGQLTVADATQLDYETTPTFLLTVRVNDSFLDATATVTVNLTDVADGTAVLVVSAGTPGSPTAIAPGTYTDITVTSTGYAQIGGPTTVTGTLIVGGTLDLGCQPLTGSGSFTLAAGATLVICDAAGLSSTPGTGAVQTTGERSFSDDAIYQYDGGTAQQTGNALPGTVRELVVNNTAGVTLTQAVRVRQRVQLAGGDLTLAGQALTLLSTADGTALVDNTGGLVVGSTGTMQRHIETNTADNGYRHYSSPVQPQTVNTLATSGYTPDFSGAAAYNGSATPGSVTPFPTVFSYNQGRVGTVGSNYSAFNQGWQASVSGEAMRPGQGFTVNAPGTVLVDFTGSFTSGVVLAEGLARGTDAAAGWQLLGNPYPSPLDWSTLTQGSNEGDNLQHLNGAVYVARSSGPYTGSYRSYLKAAPGESDPLVPAGQGFFVRTTTAGTPGTLRLTDANRVTEYGPQPAFGRSAAEARPWLQLQVAGAGTRDALTVYCDPAATLGLDAAYDASKLPNPSGLNLSALSGPEALAIDGLPALAALPAPTLVPLRLSVPTAGPYTLSVPTLANFDGATVALRDALTGTEQPLTAGYTQTLTLAPAANATPRFTLVLRPATALATATGGRALAQASVYPNPARGRFTLTLPPVAGATTATVTLLNTLGQMVGSYALPLPAGGTTASYPTTGLATGVYALRVAAGEQTATLRLVVE